MRSLCVDMYANLRAVLDDVLLRSVQCVVRYAQRIGGSRRQSPQLRCRLVLASVSTATTNCSRRSVTQSTSLRKVTRDKACQV